ncbi:MAG: glycosyltransferase, partial [Phenylobacterium sp.]|nr:glycosyltransferase [Phenylobacterium sp.]
SLARPRLQTLSGAAAVAALASAGLWISLHYCLVAWKTDPDIFVTVALWRGVREHGLGFLRSWTYTEDNWLFSLVPISSLFYSAFGATSRIAALVGWLFFVASVAMTAWLAAKLAGWRAAAITGCVLLFANYYALGHIGFLSYPITHNVSMAWGLAVLLLALWGVERQAYGPCIAAGLAVFVDAVSDPWASAAIAVPLVLASGGLAAVHRRTRLGAIALTLCLASALALWAAYKHPFGALHFLPRGHFQPGGWQAMLVNLRFGYRALAVMFNILPGGDLEAISTQVISVAALAAMVGASSLLVLWGLPRASAGRQLVGGVAVLSIGAVTTLYLLGPPASGLYVGRFFPNLYFFGALLVAMAAAERWRTGPWAAKAAVGAYAALFVASGAAMTPQLWTQPVPPSEPPAAKALGAFLQAHRLAYGYGPYWGANALAMEALTDGAVTIRPVVFQHGRVARRPVEASSLWFAPQAEPAGAPLFLVIRSDIEGCPALEACEAAARSQFGAPSERLVGGDAVVLVWRHPLAPLIDP